MHELHLMADGTYSMCRASDTEHSWHSLENVVDPDAQFDIWLDRSGMGFNINESKVEYMTDDGGLACMPSRKVLWRDDNENALSIVGSEYKVVQPRQILSFFTELCKKNHLKMDTAGVIKGGKKFWALARTGLEFNMGKDIVKDYILLATSCDGTMATTGKQTSMRVVCSNTFHVNLANGESGIRVNHSNIFEEQQMKIDLGLTTENFNTFSDHAQEMHQQTVSDQYALVEYASLLAGIKDVGKVAAERMYTESNKLKQLWGSYKDGKGAENTVWGWFNGVTYMTDHIAGRSQDSRINNSFFGSGNTLKQNAWKRAKEMADV